MDANYWEAIVDANCKQTETPFQVGEVLAIKGQPDAKQRYTLISNRGEPYELLTTDRAGNIVTVWVHSAALVRA